MKKQKNKKFKFLVGIGFFLFSIGISTAGFSQYQTILEEEDSLSVSRDPAQDLRELENRNTTKYYHKTHQTDQSLRQCSSRCIQKTQKESSLKKCLDVCEDKFDD